MDILSFPIWPEEQPFSPPSTPPTTESPVLPDDVAALLTTESKPQQALKSISHAFKRHALPPRAAYPHWEAYTPRPPAQKSESARTRSHATPIPGSSSNASRRSNNRKFALSEWRLVSEHKGQRVWVNDEGVRVSEERVSWWMLLRKHVKMQDW